MIQTKQELINAIHSNEKKILSFGVKRLGLFGSFVREEQDEKSDIDFLVVFNKGKKSFDNLFDLHETLTNLTQRKIEVVTDKGIGRRFKKHILNETEFIVQS